MRFEWLLPSVLFVVLALVVCGPAIAGRSAIGPDRTLDADSLYGALPEAVVQVHNDPTPVVLDLPRDLLFARGLHAGRLDVWNPHVACGAPLWAEQGGPFFPLKLPFYLRPSRATHHVFLALRLVLAALGAFLLARRRGQSPGAALIVGALFELSGALFAHLAFAAASAVFMLPWVLLGAQAIADATDVRGRARAAAGGAIALGITGHGGHPTLVAMVFVAFAMATAGHALGMLVSQRAAGRAAATVGFSLLAAALGLAVAAPALLPLAELASVGRSYKDTHSGEHIWSGDLHRFRGTTPVALFAPHLLGLMREKLDVLFPYLFAPTLGVCGLLLALTGVLSGGLGPSLALPLGLGLTLALSPPGLEWVHKLPVLRLIMPQYPWSLVHLPLALCAGTAVDRLSAGRGRRALVISALAMAAGALVLRWLDKDPYEQFNFREILLEALHGAGGKARLVLPLALALLLGLVAWRRWQVPSRRRATMLGALAVAELATILVPKSRLPASFTLERPPSAAVSWLVERQRATNSRMTAIPYKVGFPNTPMVYGLDDFRQVSALPVRRFIEYLSAIGPPVGFTVQTVDRTRCPLLDLAAVRWMVVRRVAAPPEPFLNKDGGLPLRWHDEHVAIYENIGAQPRFRITHQMRTSNTRELSLFLAWTLSKTQGLAPHDPPVAIEADAFGRYPTPLPGGELGAQEEVHRVDAGGGYEDPDRLVLEARLDRDGMVVVADTWYPGWQATVDGIPTSIYPADELFRAVRVPAGTHRIEMRYRPRSLRLGLALCAVALGACALFLLGTRRRT